MATAAAKAPLVADKAELFEYSPPQFFGADSRVPLALRTLISDIYVFVTIHYNFWTLPFLAAFYMLYQRGYGLVVVAILALYAPSFLSGVEKTAAGGTWDLVRLSRFWLLNANATAIKIYREKSLDATKRYIFGFHPHGIIILSRIATYGGTWEAVFPKLVTRGTPLFMLLLLTGMCTLIDLIMWLLSLCSAALGASSIFGVPLARELCLWYEIEFSISRKSSLCAYSNACGIVIMLLFMLILIGSAWSTRPGRRPTRCSRRTTASACTRVACPKSSSWTRRPR